MIKMGIIGAGSIVDELLLDYEELSNYIEIVAILSTIDDYTYNIKKFSDKPFVVYNDIDKFLNNNNIELVYVATPNHLHFHFSSLALKSKKHVVCEKPLTNNLLEAQNLRDIALLNKKMIFEAIPTLYNNNFHEIEMLLKQKDIGEIRIIECNLSKKSSRYDNLLKGNIHPVFDKNKNGGALMDLNCYNIHFVISLLGMPNNINYYPNMIMGIDVSGVLCMDYNHIKVICTAAKDVNGISHTTIQGTKGLIYINSPLNILNQFSVQYNDGHKINFINENTSRLLQEFIDIADIISKNNQNEFKKRIEHSIKVTRLMENIWRNLYEN